MLKKYIRLFFAFCLLISSLDLSAFAQVNSAASKDNKTVKELMAPAKESGKRGGFALFDPDKYEFMRKDDLMMLPGDDSAETPSENYYKYSRKYLDKVIQDTEGGPKFQEQGIEYLEILNPSLLLPIYGTTISLTGRKTFGIKYDAKKYKDSKSTITDKSYSNMEMEQEMQVKMQGKISDRIFVDIDYDDQRVDDTQNISVAYRGKEHEIVQSADFGDIELSLPTTEFISYNKQVFGAKMHLKYGGANLRLIGSQTKGESRSKQFKGDSVFESVTIRDINYMRRRYYDLTFGADPTWTYSIVPGTETVYIDDQTNQGYIEAMRVEDLKVPSSFYPTDGGNAAFKKLTRGVDYVIDYNRNILTFNNTLKNTDVVAVNYQNTQGNWVANAAGTTAGVYKIIKTSNDRPIQNTAEIGWQLEIKNYYDIGSKQITRDNGQGNFILQLLESDGREACPAGNTNAYCKFTVDYEKGIFEISGRFPDSGIYNPTPVSSANRSFFVQFTSTVRTYSLEPNIVVQSDTVKINGATMNRNRDYYIDYASGYITFYNEQLIGSNSVIDVSYEITSGGTSESALIGGRFNYDFTDNISIGASILNEGGSKPKRVPMVGDLATNLTTMEADFRIKDAEVMEGVKVTLGAEAAQSKKDENLFGYAMIENMEETKTYVKASTIYKDWFYAANPNGKSNFFDALKWDSQEVPLLEINPANAANADDKQNVLLINYDFSLAQNAGYTDRDEVSLVFPISDYGVDFTEKTLLEFSMQGELNGPLLNISFGQINEKSDNYDYLPPPLTTGDMFPTCSKYYVTGISSVPKTEDMRCTGALTPAEDTGWIFVNPDGTYQRYNPFVNNTFNRESQPNGRIDTQDLNNNGILDSEDFSSGGSFGFNGNPLLTDPSDPNYPLLSGDRINFQGWKQFQREVNFNDGTQRWTAVKQMRVTLKRAPGGPLKGTIKIANLSVSGNTWQNLDNDNSVLLTYGINNIDNPNYKPIFNDNGDGGEVFRKLYGSISEMKSDDGTDNIQEQSLAMQYDFSTTAVRDVFVQRNFSAMDLSQHKKFDFLLYNPSPADPAASFYLRIATDDSNYSEISVPMDFTNEWRLYSLQMIDTNDDGIPERWENISKYPATVDNNGYLNFKRVGIIKAGIRSSTTSKGTVWLDDIFLAEAVMTEGNAYMAEAKVDIDQWLEIGGKYKYMDDKFQTPVSVPTKQKNTEEDYYLKFKRIDHLPITATYYKANTDTPDALNYNSSNTVSLLDQGEVDRQRGTIKAEYINPKAPRIGVEYAFENTDYSKTQRSDDKNTYSANLQYNPNGDIVKNITGGISFVKNKIQYSDNIIKTSPNSYYNTDENTQNYNLKLSLQPWEGSSFVPSYNISVADEKRRYYDGASTAQDFRDKKYSKYANQNVGFTAALRISKWLAPTASYNINIKENNNLTEVSTIVNSKSYSFDIGDIKSINRIADGTLSLTLNGKEIAPQSKLLSGLSVSTAYKMQDGDTWEYVDDDFNALDKLWIRNSMGINAPYSYRTKLTLRDTYTSTMRWSPFKDFALSGMAAPIKTISIINNTSYSTQTTEELSSAYETKTSTLPDVVFFIDDLEHIFTENSNIVSGTNLKLKYSYATTDVVGREYKKDSAYGTDFRSLLFNYFDTTLTYNQKNLDKTDTRYNAPLENYIRKEFTAQTSFNYKKIRFTPKFNYILDTRSQLDNVLVSDVKEIVPSLNIKADFNLPFSLALPFISRQYLVTNRVIWNTNISYSRRRSFTVTENRNLLDINTNLDYEVSKNIRFTISGAFQKFDHIYIPEESYLAYNMGTSVTIQF